MSLQTQSLRLAGERVGSWNEVGEWGDMKYIYIIQVGVQINCCNNKLLIYQVATALLVAGSAPTFWIPPFVSTSSYSSVVQSAQLLV